MIHTQSIYNKFAHNPQVEAKERGGERPGKFAGWIAPGIAWRITLDRDDYRTGVLTPLGRTKTMKELESWGLPDFGSREKLKLLKNYEAQLPAPEKKGKTKPVKRRNKREAKRYSVTFLVGGIQEKKPPRVEHFLAYDDIHAWDIADDIMSASRVKMAYRERAELVCEGKLICRLQEGVGAR